MARECGILKVRKEDVTKVDAVIPRFDIAYYNERPSKESRAFDLDEACNGINWGISLWSQATRNHGNGIQVFKNGATTDLTSEHLRHIWYDLPRAWYEFLHEDIPATRYENMNLDQMGLLTFEVQGTRSPSMSRRSGLDPPTDGLLRGRRQRLPGLCYVLRPGYRPFKRSHDEPVIVMAPEQDDEESEDTSILSRSDHSNSHASESTFTYWRVQVISPTPTEVIQPSLSPLILSTPCDGIPAPASTSRSAARVVQLHQSASASADEEAQDRERGQDDEEFDVG
jgi:hypothetical protein